MHLNRRVTLSLLASFLTLTTLDVTVASASSPAAELAWHSCQGQFQCASLSVPLSYAAPNGPSLSLAVVKIDSTSKHPVGDLIFNPGGPGGSGVDFLEQNLSAIPTQLRANFNLVSFDPRGVDRSDPVKCATPAEVRQLMALDPAPQSAADVAKVVVATKAYVASCKADNALSLLKNVSTMTTVSDLESLRVALGQPKLYYFGLSYGTYIGELYAARFPTRVASMVLDGVVDPALPVTVSAREQAVCFETDLNDFFAWCNTDPSCARELPGSAHRDYEILFAILQDGGTLPARLPASYGGRQKTDYGIALLGVVSALYSPQAWPNLGQALGAAVNDDGTGLAALAYDYEGIQPNGQFSNAQAANTAINCLDLPSPTSVATYRSLAASYAVSAPDFGAAEAWGALPCAYWPIPPVGHPQAVSAKGAPPILLIGSTDDPATPYEWAKAVAHELTNAVLITRKGPGHTGYFLSSCIRSLTDRYLVSGTLPAPGTTCQSDPF